MVGSTESWDSQHFIWAISPMLVRCVVGKSQQPKARSFCCIYVVFSPKPLLMQSVNAIFTQHRNAFSRNFVLWVTSIEGWEPVYVHMSYGSDFSGVYLTQAAGSKSGQSGAFSPLESQHKFRRWVTRCSSASIKTHGLWMGCVERWDSCAFIWSILMSAWRRGRRETYADAKCSYFSTFVACILCVFAVFYAFVDREVHLKLSTDMVAVETYVCSTRSSYIPKTPRNPTQATVSWFACLLQKLQSQ